MRITVSRGDAFAAKGRLILCTVLGSTPKRFAISRTPSARPGVLQNGEDSPLPDSQQYRSDKQRPRGNVPGLLLVDLRGADHGLFRRYV